MSQLPQRESTSLITRVLLLTGLRKTSPYKDLKFERRLPKVFSNLETECRVRGRSIYLRPLQPSAFIKECEKYGIDDHPQAQELEHLFVNDEDYFLEYRHDER